MHRRWRNIGAPRDLGFGTSNTCFVQPGSSVLTCTGTHISTWEAPMTSTVTTHLLLSRNTFSLSATTAAAAMHDILKSC